MIKISKKFFRLLINIFSMLFIVPSMRKGVRNRLYDGLIRIESYINNIIAQKNYVQNLERIRNKDSRLKVGFLINENQKWNVQSLYDEFLKSDRFEPIVLITPLSEIHKYNYNNRSGILENEEFFKNKNIPTQRAYDIEKKKYLPIKDFDIDVLFYQQPWQIYEDQEIIETSKTMLTCYIPYCFHMLISKSDYRHRFHRQLWTYFVESNLHKINYQERFNAKNCVALGHTRMDNYSLYTCIEDPKKKKRIIFAPHHYFSQHKRVTLSWNKDEMLNFARTHQEFEWIFKPHPALKSSCIISNTYSEEEINSYYDEWGKIGTIHLKGDNFQLFRDSSCLITDSISFLAEYMPTKQPLFMLQSESANEIFNELGKKITSHYYKIHNWEEFEETFNKVIIQEDDYLKNERLEDLKCLELDDNKTVAKKIVQYLEEKLKQQ